MGLIDTYLKWEKKKHFNEGWLEEKRKDDKNMSKEINNSI